MNWFLFSFPLFFPQGHWAFIIESINCLCLTFPWIQQLTRAMTLTLVWYACVSLHVSRISLTLPIHSPSPLSLKRPAPLDWRIWVIWTTKGLLDTGGLSANTTQLDAQMMTPKVFCGLTKGVTSVCKYTERPADLCGPCMHFPNVNA